MSNSRNYPSVSGNVRASRHRHGAGHPSLAAGRSRAGRASDLRPRKIATLSARAEESAFVLLALQAPVAGDLRAIVSAIQMVADIDRMGALALHVAKIARRRHPQHALPEEVNGYFAEMGRVAVELGNSAQEVVLSHDPEKAAQIREEDDAMDDLHRHLFTVLMDREWKHGVAAAVDVTLLSRFYERFADHAVEVARRVIFQATGAFP